MSRGGPFKEGAPGRFPRVSGDEPRNLVLALQISLFSPRERG